MTPRTLSLPATLDHFGWNIVIAMWGLDPSGLAGIGAAACRRGYCSGDHGVLELKAGNQIRSAGMSRRGKEADGVD